MSNYAVTNILDLIDAIGEDELQHLLSDFSCPKNREIEDFVRKRAVEILKHVQREIGGGVVYLECEEKPQLLGFYQNEENRFRPFGERFSENEGVKYIQLLRLF